MPGCRIISRLRSQRGRCLRRTAMNAEGRGSFGALLRGYRMAAGLTQEALADRSRLSARGIADLERGVRRFPRFHTMRCLAEALELAPEDRVSFLAAGQRPPSSDAPEPAPVATWRCARCERDNAPEARFCVDCGGARGVACPACGAWGDAVDRFCHACGASRTAAAGVADGAAALTTAAEGEHKQVTVLFCQLADAAALSGRLGQEGMLSFLDSFFERAAGEVRRFEGTISSYLADGFVALFGVRMALSTGRVAVRPIGAGAQRRLSAVGETTTVAGLLQQKAEPGTILIGPATARMVTGYVRLVELGPVALPGMDGPVEAFRLTGVGPRRSPIEGVGARALSQFVGGDLEMSTLHHVLDQAASPELSARGALGEFIGRDEALAALRGPLARMEAGHGQVVGVIGEPGIGKSRLLYEFRRSLGERQVTYLEGRCLSYGASVPYLPIVDVVRANCGMVEGDAPGAVAEKVRFGLQEVGLDADRHAHYVLHLLGLAEGTTALRQLTAEAIKARMFETLRSWSLHGSRRRPLIIAIEDLHWIDRSSEEYLASLVQCLAGAPVLLLCTWRPGYRPPWSEHSYVTQLALRRLGPRDSLSVVRSVLGADRVPEALARVILQRCEGNPFFLEELARGALERGEGADDRSVPDTVEGVLMA